MHVSVTVLHVPHKEKCLYPAKAFPGNAAAFLAAWGRGGAVKRDDGFYREQAVKSPLPIIPPVPLPLCFSFAFSSTTSPRLSLCFPLSYTVVYQLPHRAHIFASRGGGRLLTYFYGVLFERGVFGSFLTLETHVLIGTNRVYIFVTLCVKESSFKET